MIKRRFVENYNCYTFCSDIVISVNPYMKLLDMDCIAEYPRQKMYKLGSDPSVYSLAHLSYWGQYADNKTSQNQSCIVSGESGSGKTLKLGESLGNKNESNDVTNMISGVSPFLEAFGNAKTNMNDNSSRFGKFTKIWFNNGKIVGAEMEHYLLEKSRISNQGKGERNYHIFYHLIRGGNSHALMIEFDCMKMNSDNEISVRSALRRANVNEETQQIMWGILAGCLKLMNLKFIPAGKEGSVVKNPEMVAEVSKLFGLDDTLLDMLPCESKVSKGNCDALARDLYSKVFAWLIEVKQTFVGLLDIFGFEVMPKNSYEQLCINFANEKLQQMFNKHVFEDEKAIFDAEKIDLSIIPDHKDNTPCCHLIGKKSKKFLGILPILDDVSVQGAGNDDTFLNTCKNIFGKDKNVLNKYNKKKHVFTIKHYAGKVVYDARKFVSKNKDKKRHKNQHKTMTSQYMSQLKNLAYTLHHTNPWYLRCIKPNDIHFRPIDVYRQLLFSGIMDVCTIKREGFPFREKYQTFCINRAAKLGYFKFLNNVNAETDPKEACRILAEEALPKPQLIDSRGKKVKHCSWALGMTMFFGKTDTLQRLQTWHQTKVVDLIAPFVRYLLLRRTLRLASWAGFCIGSKWRLVLRSRHLMKSVSLIRKIWRVQNAKRHWIKVTRRIFHREAIVDSTKLIQKKWNNYNTYYNFHSILKKLTRVRMLNGLGLLETSVVDSVNRKLCLAKFTGKIRTSLHNQRLKTRVSAHILGYLSRRNFEKVLPEFYVSRVQKHIRGYLDRLWTLEKEKKFLDQKLMGDKVGSSILAFSCSKVQYIPHSYIFIIFSIFF
eukprot:GSMAST32.ASY1.ANO1.1917.1 assembled CDS